MLVSTRITLFSTATNCFLDVQNGQGAPTFESQRRWRVSYLFGVCSGGHADLQKLRNGVLELLIAMNSAQLHLAHQVIRQFERGFHAPYSHKPRIMVDLDLPPSPRDGDNPDLQKVSDAEPTMEWEQVSHALYQRSASDNPLTANRLEERSSLSSLFLLLAMVIFPAFCLAAPQCYEYVDTSFGSGSGATVLQNIIDYDQAHECAAGSNGCYDWSAESCTDLGWPTKPTLMSCSLDAHYHYISAPVGHPPTWDGALGPFPLEQSQVAARSAFRRRNGIRTSAALSTGSPIPSIRPVAACT
jgi:hypothetical protein